MNSSTCNTQIRPSVGSSLSHHQKNLKPLFPETQLIHPKPTRFVCYYSSSSSSYSLKREEKMGSRLGRRVIHFANLPMKLLLPSPPLDCVREFALKTIPSASKIEIRRVLESLYGFDVEEVRTLNREGKKRKVAGYLAAKPDYKKAYVTLRYPLSVSPDLFPIPWIQEAIEKKQLSGKKKSKPKAVVEDDGDEEADKGKLASSKHWLHKDDDDLESRREPRGGHHQYRRDSYQQRNRGGGSGGRKNKTAEKKEEGKFPWSSMPSWK